MGHKFDSKVLHTGGAQGADTLFCSIGLHLGMEVVVHSFQGHKMSQISRNADKVIKHSRHELEKAKEPMKKAQEELGRSVPRQRGTDKFILRSYFQVANAELVLVIATIQDLQSCRVDGDTGYPVKLAHMMGGSILIFDQKLKRWFYSVESRKLKPLGRRPDASKFPNVIAGTGDKDLAPGVEREVLKIFENARERGS